MNYLGEREQSVVLDGIKSSSKPVLSGVPQGSILGPIRFVLFINDLPQGISEDTHLALYADDTKIWRSIRNEEDIVQLQKDINNLHMWSINNKMMFHPDKCKVVTITHKPSPLAMLPFVAYHYHLAENLLSYADMFNDMNLFHKVVYKIIPVTMPDYLTLYSGDSRLRSTHLENLCFVSNIASTTTSISNLNKSFFFRSHTLWNFLSFDLRNSMKPSQFKIKLAKHYWNMASTDIEQPEDEWSF